MYGTELPQPTFSDLPCGVTIEDINAAWGEDAYADICASCGCVDACGCDDLERRLDDLLESRYLD